MLEKREKAFKEKALDNGWEAMQEVMKDYTLVEQAAMKRGILQNTLDLWLFGADMDSSTKYIMSKIAESTTFGIQEDMEFLEITFDKDTNKYYRPVYSKKVRKRLNKQLAKNAKLAAKEDAEKKKIAERSIKQVENNKEQNEEKSEEQND